MQSAKTFCLLYIGSWGSSVSKVSDYRLNDRGSIASRDFSSSLCVYSSSEVHTTSYPFYSIYSFLTSALDGGEWSASPPLPPALYPRIKDPRYALDRRLGRPRAGPDTEARGKISCLFRGSNLDRPVVQSVATHYTD
jgi:hypothetical protein